MTFNPLRHHRKSIRLNGRDYSLPGAYYVTLCVHDRKWLFGEILKGEMVLNDAGHYAKKCWMDIPEHFLSVNLDEFVIMPNHVHGILIFRDVPVGAEDDSSELGITVRGANDYSTGLGRTARGANDYSTGLGMAARGANDYSNDLGMAVRGANDYSPLRGTTKTVGSVVRGFKIGVTKWFRKKSPGAVIWQRNYYDHIGRDENDLFRVRNYIHDNPINWDTDEENP